MIPEGINGAVQTITVQWVRFPTAISVVAVGNRKPDPNADTMTQLAELNLKQHLEWTGSPIAQGLNV